MKMVFHILLKDLRRTWREIALFTVAIAGWAWIMAHPEMFLPGDVKTILPVAVSGSWITRAVRISRRKRISSSMTNSGSTCG